MQPATLPPVNPAYEPALSASVLPRRFLALILDTLIICLTGWVAAFLIFIFGIFTLGLGWLAYHIIPVIPFAYYTLLIGGTGATPGQRAAGLVVRQNADFSAPNLAQALVWSVLLWLSFVLACIPFLVMFMNPRHRATHDILSGLIILSRREIPC